MREDKILVPVDLIEAVAHIGVDFGYGDYELEQKFIEMARRLFDEYKEQKNEQRN